MPQPLSAKNCHQRGNVIFLRSSHSMVPKFPLYLFLQEMEKRVEQVQAQARKPEPRSRAALNKTQAQWSHEPERSTSII